MKYIILFFLLYSLNLSAQPKIELIEEQTDNGINIFIKNDEYCPVSVKFEYDLTNMESQLDKNNIIVIPPRSKQYFINEIKIIKPNKKAQYSIQITSNYGDYFNNLIDTNYHYDLPFTKGNAFYVSQGYNGKQTHKGINALDFSMPIGTAICAIRDGIVVKVVDSNNKGCDNKSCIKYNNYIIIYHSDGTFSEYSHIKRNSVKVKEGSKIKKGQVIAQSGNVGYSTGPHLHIIVYTQKLNQRTTIKTLFKTNDGSQVKVIEPYFEYKKEY